MDDTATQLTIEMPSTQVLVHGPTCRFSTRRIHSRDGRQGSGSPLGTMARRAAPAGVKVLLHQWPLPTPDFHGAAVAARRSLDTADAADAYRKVLMLGEKASNHGLLASAYGNLGLVYAIRGDLDQAEAMCRKALTLFHTIGAAPQVK